jgi:small GTP-binding protein
LLDTAGPEDYDRLRPLSYPQTDVFLVVFSVVNPPSFRNVVQKWLPEIRLHCPDVPILLCGSKIDLREDIELQQRMMEKNQKTVTYEEGEFLAWASGCIGYVENSALTQKGLNNTLECMIRSAGAWSEYRFQKKKKTHCKTQ